MKNFNIALVHCPKSTTYKIVKMTPEMDQDDPCIMWVFSSDKIKMAEKMMTNLNVARFLNAGNNQLVFS